MSDLTVRDPDKLSRALDDLDDEQILNNQPKIEALLSNHYVLVRLSAAAALGRMGKGLQALLQAIDREPDDLVASEICDSLGEIADPASSATLRKVAAGAASPLLRSSALLALVEVEWNDAEDYFSSRFQLERSRSVLATLSVILYTLGRSEYRKYIIKSLGSRDYKVRCRTVNLLVDFLRQLPDLSLQSELETALHAEPARAVRCDLENAICAFSNAMRGQTP